MLASLPKNMRTNILSLSTICAIFELGVQLSGLPLGILLSGCGQTWQAGSVSRPTMMNLYPVAATPENPARLFILVQGVGAQSVRLPLAFDTGSAGLTLNALSIFPSSMVTSSGFVFASSETTLTFQGITVTQQSGTRAYGGATGRTEHGNIGFAAVTFGDSQGTLTTEVMPVFLYYAVTENATGELASEQQQEGWFGVNDEADLISIPGSTRPAQGFPVCSEQTSGSCFVDSVFKHLTYSPGVDAGFAVAPAPLSPCDISLDGGCPAAPMLTVGLRAANKDGFSAVQLTCPPSGFVGPATIGPYADCQSSISNSIMSAASDSFATNVLFDSGTPYVAVNVPTGQMFSLPTGGAPVSVETPSGFTYSLVPGTGVDAVLVTSPSTAQSIVGLAFFASDFLFIDFSESTEGWKK
jgi:hypothetical protein